MLKPVLDIVATPLKKLPGFPLVLILVSGLYLQAFGKFEATWREGIVLFITWAVYRLGGYLDEPMYDTFFGPGHRQLPVVGRWQRWLDELRDTAVKRIFEGVVSSYDEARKTERIAESGSRTLYNVCASLLRKTKAWDEVVARPLDISKSARALVILLPMVAATLAWSDSRLVEVARQRLGYFGDWRIHIVGGFMAVLVFVVARYLHHRRLYQEVSERVRHVPLVGGKRKAEIVEDELIVD